MRGKYLKFKLLKKIFKRFKKHKLLKKFFFLNLVLLISGIYNIFLITPVFADPFYPGADVQDCNFAQATSVSYRSLPNNCTGANCISYNTSHVYGESGVYPENHNFHDIANVLYPNAHRYRGVADRVGVPPNTRIDVGYYTYNYSGHTVTSHSAYLFMSRHNLNNGDWGRLGAGGTVGSVNYRYFNTTQTRHGRYVYLTDLGTYPAHSYSNPPNGKTVYSFTTIQPIQIQSRSSIPEFLTGGNLRIRYDLTIRNVSAYNLSNIRVVDELPSGEVYDQTHSFSAGQTRTFTYYANMGVSYPTNITNSPARVSDPNRQKEEGALASHTYGNANPETKTIIVNRTDLGAPADWTGAQPDFSAYPFGDYYFLELIPYTVYSGNTTTNVPPNITVEKVVSDSDEFRVEVNSARPDEEITYDITVRNTGGNATNVVAIDDYDQTLLEILDTGGGIDNGDTITWNIGLLANQQVETFTIRAKIIAPLPHGTYQAPNTVTVTSDQTPPISDTTQTNITAEVRMEIDKRVSDSDETNVNSNHIQGGHPANTERQSTYSITITNSGDADAHQVSILDDVSQIIRYGRIFNISDNGILTTRLIGNQLVGDIVWDIGNLAQQESRNVSFDVQFTIGIEDNTVIENIAEVRTQEVPPVSDSTLTTIHAPILRITKDDGIETAEPSQTVHWVINVENIGTGNAYNVEVYDFVPDIMTVQNISDGGAWDPENRVIVWSTTEPHHILNGSFNPDPQSVWGQNKVLSFDTVLDPVFPIGITELNNVVVAETSFYPSSRDEHLLPVYAYPQNEVKKYVFNQTAYSNNRANSGYGVSHIEYGADASMLFNNEEDVHVVAGDTLKYTIIYRNVGNAHSPDTYVRDRLPRYINDIDGTPIEVILLDGISNLDDAEIVVNDSYYEIIWNIGELTVSDEWQVKQFELKINSDSTQTLPVDIEDRIIDNFVEIFSENELVEIQSDNATVLLTQPNAIITKDADKTEYQSDEQIKYLIRLENSGSSLASGILTDTLPDGVYFISTDYPEDKYEITDEQIIFDILLNPQEIIEIEIVVGFTIPIKDLDIFLNEVHYSYTDVNVNDRPVVHDSSEVLVHAPILEIEKNQDLPSIVAPAQAIIYTIHYRNVGTGYAPNTVITDTLSEHLEFVEFMESDVDGVFYSEDKTVVWDLGNLESGEEGTVSFKAVIKIPTVIGTEILNTAIIESPVIEIVSSEVATVVGSSCCLGGFIWEDSNNNGIYDSFERGIPNVLINIKWAETEYTLENSVDIYTQENGYYEYVGLPYHTLITVKVFKPEGYDNITTPDEFQLVLLPPNDTGEIEDYEIDGVRYLTASGCVNFLNSGIYRDVVLAQTGQSIVLPLIIGIVITVIGLGGLTLLVTRRRKKK